jgi:hypothetical protein
MKRQPLQRHDTTIISFSQIQQNRSQSLIDLGGRAKRPVLNKIGSQAESQATSGGYLAQNQDIKEELLLPGDENDSDDDEPVNQDDDSDEVNEGAIDGGSRAQSQRQINRVGVKFKVKSLNEDKKTKKEDKRTLLNLHGYRDAMLFRELSKRREA